MLTASSLDIEIVCYFATKSIDEFLSLQQTANMQVIEAIHACGADLALPTSLMRMDSPAADNQQQQPHQAASAGTSRMGAGANKAGDESTVRSSDKVVSSLTSTPATSSADAAWEAQSDLADEMELAEALSEYVD